MLNLFCLLLRFCRLKKTRGSLRHFCAKPAVPVVCEGYAFFIKKMHVYLIAFPLRGKSRCTSLVHLYCIWFVYCLTGEVVTMTFGKQMIVYLVLGKIFSYFGILFMPMGPTFLYLVKEHWMGLIFIIINGQILNKPFLSP